MAESKTILSKVLLALQLCLAFWQIVKLTPFGAIIKGLIAWLTSLLPFGLGTLFSPTYSRLKGFDTVLIFKRVNVHWTKESDQPIVSRQKPDEISDRIDIEYLGNNFRLERRDGNKLFVNGEMSYYITDAIWHSLLHLKTVASGKMVFLKGHKDLFTYALTGGLMELSEVLDSVILANHSMKSLPYDNRVLVIPINLSISEEKLLKALNLVGLFFQTKNHVHWLIPTLFSFTSAVMEFATPLKQWIYTNINRIFCWALHLICDRLAFLTRLLVYNLLSWVENMKPSNDLQYRVVRADICAVIGGGAKVPMEGASLVQPNPSLLSEGETYGKIVFNPGPVKIISTFEASRGKCRTQIFASENIYYHFEVDCKSMDEYKNLITFVSCLEKNRCGSLKSYEPNSRVCKVRGIRESVYCYAHNGFPAVYELQLKNAVVK